jgi:Serine carboxypeptidase S28
VIDGPDEFNLTEKLPHVSRLLFVNGMNDGWSVGCVTNTSLVSDSSRVINMVNGAHHSDLSHTEPSDLDTADIKQARIDIANQIGLWLDEIRAERQAMAKSVD